MTTRRDFLSGFAAGFGGVALAGLLTRDGLLRPATPGGPHFAPRARRAIQIFLQGGLSQVDSFDYKPALEKHHGQPPPADANPDVFFKKIGLLHRSHFPFHRRGESGLWVSDLFTNIATVADELAVVRSDRIQIFLQGGLSQVDSFDYKPALEKHHGQPPPADANPDVFFKKIGLLHRSHFPFHRRGESGLWVSDLFTNIATVADELAVVR